MQQMSLYAGRWNGKKRNALGVGRFLPKKTLCTSMHHYVDLTKNAGASEKIPQSNHMQIYALRFLQREQHGEPLLNNTPH